MKALVFAAVVLGVTDGDTLKVRVPAWSHTPFETISLRLFDLDTPESRRHLAKCEGEFKAGIGAKRFAAGLVKPRETVQFTFAGMDKYGGRVLASVTLPDGRDLARTMIAAGHGRTYDGGKKGSWCS